MDRLNRYQRPAAWRCPSLTVLCLLACWQAWVTPVRADNPPTFLFQWGSSGNGNGQFYASAGIAMDSNTNIYITDIDNQRIQKFDQNGNYLAQWGTNGTGNGQFAAPAGIAVDSSNNVYVADGSVNYTGNNNVQKFDQNGDYLTQWGTNGTGNGQFAGPGDIALNASNDVYVVDGGNNRVEEFDSNGNYLTQWGSAGSGNGQFSSPAGIAIDASNNVYVVDTRNDRVQKFDGSGNYLTQWGSLGSGNGQFQLPAGIAVDASNHVYVADPGNSRVQKFDGSGNYLTQWGGLSGGTSRLVDPAGLVLDPSGNFIYVADTSTALIKVFANDATQLRPYISVAPTNQTVLAGANVTFTAGAAGATPLAYQWASNSVPLASMTNSTFTLTSVTPAEAAAYTVTVTNSVGGTTSTNALLIVVPATVSTLIATGITAASAVLRGTVTASEPTAAFFNWGTTTNYGNVTPATLVAGTGAASNITATVSGLSTNRYYFQLVATNTAGIAYGSGLSVLVVDEVPAVTTLLPVNSADGTMLNALINPNGLDTTVYFKWGVGAGSRTNLTPPMDAGAGGVSLSMSNFLTGLAATSYYSYQVVASNALGMVSGAATNFFPPPFASVPAATWESVACSADGSKLVAAANNAVEGAAGAIYISTNNGATWYGATNANVAWESVAMSADGGRLIAAIGLPDTGPIYLSTNFGTGFKVAALAGSAEWNAVASSADGTKLAAASESSAFIEVSTNSGTNWTSHSGFSGALNYVACSADGVHMVAASQTEGQLYFSTNTGVSWKQATNAPNAVWYGVASSANGSQMLACAYPGGVYISTNGGVLWSRTSLTNNNWNSVAESADGTKMVAVANSALPTINTGKGGIWTSSDSGKTWVSNNVPSAPWTSVTMSADGNEFAASMGYPTAIGGIYVSQTMPSPVLSLAVTNSQCAVSWPVPSTPFTLQQSSDLLNWTAVTNPPALVYTNLSNQVALPPPAGNNFFRLMH